MTKKRKFLRLFIIGNLIGFTLFPLNGCGKEEIQKLRSEIETLKQEKKTLSDQVNQLKSQILSLEEENKKLKETDQYYFQKAVEFFKSNKWSEAKDSYQTLIDRFPASPLVAEAKKGLININTEIKRIERERVLACQNLSKKIQSASALEATKLIDDFIASDSEAPCVEEFRKKKEELTERAERERKEKEALAELGVEIYDFRTYWTIKRDVLGAQELAVPFIRFKVKNVGDKPIEKLHVKASFLLTDKKEVLGEGDKYVIGHGDAPLKPGFPREVFFGSSTGYTGLGIFYNRPKVSADLYLDLGKGKTLVKSFNINQKLEGY